MRRKPATPTALVEMSERKPVAIVAEMPKVSGRYALIIVSLLRLTLQWLWHWLRRDLTPQTQARVLAAFFERMGFLWVKVAQLMAVRSDVYSDEVCRTLSQLKYREFGFPTDVAERVVEAELGRPVRQVFAEFDPVPFRAASTFQVHRAVLPNSEEWVAVKVQRPNIEPIFRKDMTAIRILVRILCWLRIQQHARWEDVLWELDHMLTAEVDYRYEASNMRRMRRNLRKQRIHVPRVHEELSTRRVLVMEFVRGALMSDLVQMTQTEPLRLRKWLQENNIKPRRVGRKLFVSFMRQLMEDNLLHGNLHPGNIILLRDSKFAFVDLSVLITVETEFLRRYMQSMRALAGYQYGHAADLTLLLCPELPIVDLAMVKDQMVRSFRAWDLRSELKRMPYPEKSLANMFRDVSRAVSSWGIVPSLSYMRLAHTWSTLDDSLSLLLPDANYSFLFRKYIRAAHTRAFWQSLSATSIVEGIASVRDSVQEYQQMLGPMLRRGALVFQGGRTKLSDTLAGMFRILRFGTLAAAFVIVLRMLDLFYPATFDGLPGADHWHGLVREIPIDNFDVMAALLIVLAYLFCTFHGLVRRLRQQDIRLPNTSVLSSRGT